METQSQIAALLNGALPNQRTVNFAKTPNPETGFERFFQREINAASPAKTLKPQAPESAPPEPRAPEATRKSAPEPKSSAEKTTPASEPPESRKTPESSETNRTAEQAAPAETPKEKPSAPVAVQSPNDGTATAAAEARGDQSPLLTGLSPNEQALIRLLEELGLTPEALQPLIDLLNNTEPGPRQGLVQALQGLLNSPETVPVPAETGSGLPEAESPLPKAGVPQQLVKEALVQLGLSETEAGELIGQVRAALSTKTEADPRLVHLAETDEAEAVKPRENDLPPVPDKARAPEPKAAAKENTNPFLKPADAPAKETSDLPAQQAAPDKNLQSLQQTAATLSPARAAAATSNLQPAAGPQASAVTEAGSTPPAASAADNAAKTLEALKPASAETYSGRATVVKSVAAQIVEKFSLRGMGQQREIQIRLEPPSLGTVRMNVTSSGESVRTTIVAENQMVKQVIESNLSQLKDSIASQGLKVGDFTVLVGGQSEQNRGARNGEQSGAFRPFDALSGGEAVEEPVRHLGRYFFSDRQSISLFA